MAKAFNTISYQSIFNRSIFNLMGLGVLIVIFLFSCSNKSDKLFKLKEDTGIQFNNKLTPTPKLNILTYLYYYNGGGVAAADFNNDGLVDLYFTGNQVADRIYINNGDFKFQDVTGISGIDNQTGWTTGVTIVDINHDGFLDIYISKIGKYNKIKGKNLLYINQGSNINNAPSFVESASAYGLDIQSFSTQSAFFDYDLDGDLDMYLLNYSVFPNRTYGKGSLREQIDSLSGDKLFKNENNKFVDISQEAGIFQGKIGYGLGLAISDVNNDGFPDIYIGNDFFENDYLYINQKDGSFKEIISDNETNVGHTSHFSMGNDIADINNDGWTDILSLDMLPESLEAYKTSANEYNNPIYEQYLKNGYRPQYMQNALLLNNEGAYFHEIAFASGIAATDWSWAPLIVDLDNDGFKDIFISNGILGATNDMDFINYIANKKIQEQISSGMEERDQKFTETLPQRKLINYFYKNNEGLQFTNQTKNWFEEIPSFSNGSIYADLDNDGDQDLVINNINSPAFVLENNSESTQNKHIRIKFRGSNKNTQGIGVKIRVYADSLSILQENYVSRGYLSAVSPEIIVGIGKRHKIDSLTVIWPGGKYQTLKNITAGSDIVLEYIKADGDYYSPQISKPDLFTIIQNPIAFKHKELTSYEFEREPLIPYSKGAEGPAISIGDINNDGREDLYIGGGKKQPGVIFFQKEDGSFVDAAQKCFALYAANEETDNHLFDADNDGDLDLIIVSGGNESKAGKPIQPRLFLNDNGEFTYSDSFPKIEINASVIRSLDLDQDGDLDLVIGSNALPQKFGRSARNYILQNDGNGNFKDISDTSSTEFATFGLIEDLDIVDLDHNGFLDIIVVGHWAPIGVFMNSGGKLKLRTDDHLQDTNGLWNCIRAADFDNDGDIDFIAGNWGINTRFQASQKEPMKVYMADFDNNGKEEAIVTYFQQGRETVFSSKDDLSKQIPSINKKFLLYADFAKAKFTELLDTDKLKQAEEKKVLELSSCFFENDGKGVFTKKPLPYLSQMSSIKTLMLNDFDHDGFIDILAAGNDYAISTQLGRLDASHGSLIINDGNGSFKLSSKVKPSIQGQARDIERIYIDGKPFLIVTINNQEPLFLKINNAYK